MEENIEKLVKYEPPMIKKVEKMTFSTEWINEYSSKNGNDIYCKQCSGCHGCR